MESKRYPTDLSDEEWGLLETYLPASKRRGRPRLHSPRAILNAVFYVLKSGCQWRMLPRDFPPWKTVFHYLLQSLAHRWHLGEVTPGDKAAVEGASRSRSRAQRWCRGFAVGQDERG